jgi:hypothetical protein
MEWYVATLILFLLAGVVVIIRDLPWHNKNVVTSRTFLIITSLGIGVLNLLALSKGAVAQQILATLLLGFSVYPMWRYLRRGEVGIPFVPLTAIIYGVFYGLPALLPFEVFRPYCGVSSESLMKTQILVAIGLLVVLFAFYKFPKKIWRDLLPQVSMEWSELKAKYLAVVLGVFGIIANVIFQVIEVPMALGAIITFCRLWSLIAIAIFFLLRLRGRLPLMSNLFLWLVLIPLQIFVDIGGGSVFPILRLGMMLLMLYLLVRRNLPYRWILIGVPILFLLLGTKGEFRKVTWGEGRTMTGNPIEKGMFFFQVTSSFISSGGPDTIYSAYETALQRFDLLTLFSYIVDETPVRVPYWGGETYQMLFWMWIPRFLYPDKPVEDQGQNFGHRYAILHSNDLTTSWNIPQLVEMYANFGMLGVVFGMFLIGLTYQGLHHILNHPRAGSWGMVSSAVILSNLMNIDSNFTVVYGNTIYYIMLLYLLGLFVRQRAPVMDPCSLSILAPNQ